MSETSDKIRGFILEELLFEDENASISDDSKLLEGTIDSLGLMQLVAFIESEFDIQVPETEITSTRFATVRDVAGLVDQLRT